MKKLLCKTFCFGVFTYKRVNQPYNNSSFALPNLYSEGIYLMDTTTGKVLYEKKR